MLHIITLGSKRKYESVLLTVRDTTPEYWDIHNILITIHY